MSRDQKKTGDRNRNRNGDKNRHRSSIRNDHGMGTAYPMAAYRRTACCKRKYGQEVSASITVEAAFVVPLACMVIFLLISLDFYVHDKSYYTLCALETALTGSSLGREDRESGEQYAKEKLASLTRAHRMPTEVPGGSVEVDEKRAKVTVEGTVYRLWGRGTWTYTVSGTAEIVRPQERIRQIRTVKGFLP